MMDQGAGSSLQGWVLWRSEVDVAPQFRWGTIMYAGGKILGFAEETAPNRDSDNHGEQAHYIVPGLVDMHAHLAIGSAIPSSDQIRANAWRQIRAGVLAIREPGSPVKVSPQELPFGRPIVISAGRHIAAEKRYIRGLGVELSGCENTSDPEWAAQSGRSRSDSLVLEVQNQTKSGDGWIKLVGDWIDRSHGADADLDTLWTSEEVQAAIDAAHEGGSRVAVHAFGPAPIDAFLDAGVDSIEHGAGMSYEQMRRAAEKGTAVIPTLLQVEKFPEFAEAATKYPRYAATMTGLYERRHDWFTDLLRSGVNVLVGSDAGGYQGHGRLTAEMQTMVAWGMPVEDVFAAATWKARDFLGLQSLQNGADADMIVFKDNPMVDPHTWDSPQAIIAAGHHIVP